jgi:hypothetical protein
MSAADCRGSRKRLRQEQIAPLKSFACGYRFWCNSGRGPVVASEQDKVITGPSPSPPMTTVATRSLSVTSPLVGEHRPPSAAVLEKERRSDASAMSHRSMRSG